MAAMRKDERKPGWSIDNGPGLWDLVIEGLVYGWTLIITFTSPEGERHVERVKVRSISPAHDNYPSDRLAFSICLVSFCPETAGTGIEPVCDGTEFFYNVRTRSGEVNNK